MNYFNYHLKIVLLGDLGVGKSSLVNYLGQLESSTSADCFARSKKSGIRGHIELEVKKGDKNILVRIYDTGGQERYRSLTSSYYRGAHGCILMYDATNEESFHNIQNWYSDLQIYQPEQNMSTILTANKCLSPDRVVTTEHGEKHAEHLELPYMEIDVQKGINVIAMVNTLVDSVIKETLKTTSAIPRPVALNISEEKFACKNMCCCTC